MIKEGGFEGGLGPDGRIDSGKGERQSRAGRPAAPPTPWGPRSGSHAASLARLAASTECMSASPVRPQQTTRLTAPNLSLWTSTSSVLDPDACSRTW
eukprot:2102515-Rhodomonas_salina.1